MISKEEFVETINFIIEKREQEKTFVRTLEKLSPGCYCDCYLYDEYEQKLIDTLEIMLNDYSHEISYYCYDCNGLEKLDKKHCPKMHGKYLYTSLETLYDYLIKENCDGN